MLYEDQFPIDENAYTMAVKFGIDPTLCVLSGGEDYELLFTIHKTHKKKFEKNPDITIIGEIVEKGQGTSTQPFARHGAQGQDRTRS